MYERSAHTDTRQGRLLHAHTRLPGSEIIIIYYMTVGIHSVFAVSDGVCVCVTLKQEVQS